ncbi:MAG: haloacid dehalogenase-like hydrolase [Oscillospiraceae bacterium]|nr:haloacid dehalogenase-like hydrolase [Oscillospiraceae bacterium]
MTDKTIIAIMYDFDKTLCTKDMQDYAFIPSLNMTTKEFWGKANEVGTSLHMDSVLAYMYTMLLESKERNIPLTRKSLVEKGNKIEFFPGVKEWFSRINSFAEKNNVSVEHYVISSGLKEIIEGTSISGEFKEIYGCEFVYDNNGLAVFPKTAVNYTNKTQFVYRINKGVLDVANDYDLNKSMPDDSKRIPFCNMIYIGDGLSDVPCMKMMKSYGGVSIAVYQNDVTVKVMDLLQNDRVDYIYPADYSEGSGLDKTVKNIIRKMAVCETLFIENFNQKNGKFL